MDISVVGALIGRDEKMRSLKGTWARVSILKALFLCAALSAAALFSSSGCSGPGGDMGRKAGALEAAKAPGPGRIFRPGGSRRDHACSDIRRKMLAAVNRARSRARMCGRKRFGAAAPLRWDSRLEAAAYEHSRDMAGKGFMGHKGSDGSSVRQRIVKRGYLPWIWGENVAYGQMSVDEVVGAWLASPGHCENIMTPEFRDMGGACVMGSRKEGSAEGEMVPYWTLVFATSKR